MLPTFTALSSAWLFLLTIPLIVFYFLKLRRNRHTIPSLALWRQVVADQRVNSPFQRFKRHILLLLQLLLLLFLVLAALQPVLHRTSSGASRLPILIDNSASMAALDQPGGTSRLDAVKARLREMIANLPADQQVCLIAFNHTARRLTGFTNSQAELRDALAALQVEDVAGDLDDGLRMAQGLARTENFDRIWLLSDGNFPARTPFELSFRVDYQRVAPAGSNFGLTACNARRDLDGQWEIFVQLAGSSEAESTTGTVEMRQGDQVLASERVALAKGSAPRLSFRLASKEAAEVELRFLPEGFDALASDNSAWLRLPAARPLSAFVPETLARVRHALAAMPGVTIFPDQGATQAGYDLLITDRESDLATPARVVASFGLVPADLQNLVTIEKATVHAIDWRRDATTLLHVNLDDVLFTEDPHLAAEVTETRFRELGYTLLAEGPHGPLLVEKNEADRLFVHTLFHPDRSTLIYRVGFPVLVSNLVQAALRRGELSEVNAATTGVLPALTLAAGANVRIAGPRQYTRAEAADRDGRLAGIPAPHVGVYTLAGAGEPIALGAALLSATETSLAGIEQIEFAEQLKVAARSTAPKMDRALWWPLCVVALGLLAVEWWWFQRRPARA